MPENITLAVSASHSLIEYLHSWKPIFSVQADGINIAYEPKNSNLKIPKVGVAFYINSQNH